MRDDGVIRAKILIVDDQLANVRLLERVLATAGYTDLASTTDPREVLERYRTFQPDMILLDLLMPHLDGVAVLEQLKPEIPVGAFLPVLILTADVTLEAKRRALAAGAHDFLTKPFEHLEVVLRIGNLLNTRVATNGAAALEILGKRAYDAVLSDTKMPVMDGEAFFTEAARRDPTFERRIIFLTGDVLSREKREFLERTGAPVLTKPCDLREVRRLVQRVVTQNAGVGSAR